MRGMEGLCFLNKEWVELDSASIPISDLGLVRGYGVFDYLRTYNGRPFHLLDHLTRLERSAEILDLTLPMTFQEIEAVVEEILRRTGFSETSIKLILTGGQSSDQFTYEDSPTFCVMAYPFKPFPNKYYEEGVAVCTTRALRSFPQAKSTCYLTAMAAMKKAKLAGAQDALYVNQQNEVLEALTGNIFVVKKGRLITPLSEEILYGITREVVRRCAEPDIEVEIAPLPLSEVESWDEAFITSTSREVMPVVSMDGRPIGEGKIGAVTKEMHERFKTYTNAENWPSFCHVNNLIDASVKYL
jgi:branched-chain amino acid aminotransferase